MISSESINFSKYTPINRNDSSISTDLENNTLNNINENNASEEISDIIENEKNKDILYGNHKSINNPIKIGNCFAFCYNSIGNPLITIGPDCKIIFKYIIFELKLNLVWVWYSFQQLYFW